MKKGILACLALIGMHTAMAQLPNYHWNNTLNGGSNGTGFAVIADPLGNVYTVGRCGGTSDFDPSGGVFNLTGFGGEDIFVLKVDAQGNFLWAKNFGGSGKDLPTAIALTPARELVVVGQFEGTADFDPSAATANLTSAGGDDGFVFKLSEAGNLAWAKSFASTGNVIAKDVSTDAAGNIYITGDFYQTLDLDPGSGTVNVTSVGQSDIFVSKLNGSGAYLDGVRIGGTSVERSNGLAFDDNSVYVTGVYTSNVDFDPGASVFELSGGFDVYVLKLTSNLDFSWAKSIGTVGTEEGFEVETFASSVYIAGQYHGTMDFDPGAGEANMTSVGGDDVFILKLSSDGLFQFVKTFGSTGTEDFMDLSVSASGGIYLTGDLGGPTMDADPGAGTFNLTRIGAEDIYHIGLNANGEFSWAASYGFASTFTRGRGIYADANENIYTTGQYGGTIDFNPNAGVNTFGGTDAIDIFTQKLGPGFNNLEEGSNSDFFNLYPNPSKGTFTISTPTMADEKSIQVYDLAGKILATETRIGFSNDFDVSHLKSGSYFVKVTASGQTQTVKLSKN